MLASNKVAASVAALVIQDKKLLLGRRFVNNQFIGWQCPGGYLHAGETIEQASRRLCMTKAGIEIDSLRPGPYSNNIFSEKMHTVTLYVFVEDCQIQNSKVFENKETQWSWFSFDEFPKPLFLPLDELLKQHKLFNLIQLSLQES